MSYKKNNEELHGLQDAISSSAKDFTEYDPIGLPDEKDVENIKTIIRNHEKAHPGEIAKYVLQAREERAFENLSPLLKLNDKVASHRVMTMPIALMREIEAAYPLMFRNRKHSRWFRRMFPLFNTTTKR